MNKKIFGIVMALSLIGLTGLSFSGIAVTDPIEVCEASIAGMLIGALVGVVVAAALLPIIGNQTTTLETDSAGDFSTSEESLIGLWPTLIIVGVMMAIIGFAL